MHVIFNVAAAFTLRTYDLVVVAVTKIVLLQKAN